LIAPHLIALRITTRLSLASTRQTDSVRPIH
jgi:hypothetical protein